MSTELSLIVFLILTVGLMVLPFVPAIVEWRRQRDAEPLRVVRDSQVDIRHFASGFREFLGSTIGDLLSKHQVSRKPERGTLEDGTPYLVVGDRSAGRSEDDMLQNLPGDQLVLAAGDLHLAGNTLYPTEIYARGSVVGGQDDVLRAILAERNIDLGRGSTALRWLHSGRSLNVETGCVLYGRASADESMHIEDDCFFQRLNAPVIHFCIPQNPGAPARQKYRGKPAILNRYDVPNRVEEAAGRWLVFGDMKIPDGKRVENDIVVTGRLDVGERVEVRGSIKSRQEMHLGSGVEIEGSVVCEGDIYIGSDCRISGPVLSEKTIFIHAGTSVGSRQHPTTVSSEKIFIEPGVSVHGTIWAHREGRVATFQSRDSKKSQNDSIKI